MIGCERLCGQCEACALLAWGIEAASRDGTAELYAEHIEAARRDPTHFGMKWTRAHVAAVAAAIDPSALADILARALRGRGVAVYAVEDDPGDAIRYPCAHVDPDGDVIAWQAWTSYAVYAQHVGNLVMPQARSALSRLLAAGPCGPDEALRLLEGT